MSNDFYGVSGAPSQGSFGSSATVRAEFAAIEAGFNKMPTLAGNNSKLLRVNSAASGLEAFTHDFLTTTAAAAAYVAKAGDAMSGVLTVAGSAQTFGNLNIHRYGAAPYASVAVGDFTTATNTVGLYLRQTSGVAGISTGGADLTFFRAGPGTTAAGTISGSTGAWTIPAPSSGTALTVTANGSPGLLVTSATGATTASSFLNTSNGVRQNLTVGSKTAGGADVTLLISSEGDAPDGLIQTSTNHPLVLGTNNTGRMTLGASGNVTINAPSSGTALSLAANATATTSAIALVGSTTGAHFISGTNTGGSFILGMESSAGNTILVGAPAYASVFGATNSTSLILGAGNTSRLSIAAAGNVTINAPSSGTALAVTGISGNNHQTWSDGTVTVGVQTAGGTAAYIGSTTNHRFELFQNNISRVVIGLGGNVTVNAPSSGTALAIANVSGSRNLQLTGASGSAAYFAIVDGKTGTREWQINVGNSTIGNFEIRDSTAGSDRFKILGSTGEVDVVAGSGKLLVGGNITRFESSELTCPSGAAGTTSVSHGGPRAPDVVYAVLRCKTAELNWAVGDEVDLASDHDGSTAVGNYIAANATTCYFGASNTPAVRNRTTLSLGTVTPANWRVVFRCIWL